MAQTAASFHQRFAGRLVNSNADLLTLEIPPEFRNESGATVKVVLDQTYRSCKEAQNLFRGFEMLQEPQCTADFLARYSALNEWKLHDTLEELVAWNFLGRGQDMLYRMHDVVHSYAEFRTRTIRHVETKRMAQAVQDYVAFYASDVMRLHQNLPNILYTAGGNTDEVCLAILTPLALDGYQDHFGYRLSYLELLDRGLQHLFTKHAAGELSAEEGEQLHHLLSKRGNASFDQKDYQLAAEVYRSALAFAYSQERRVMLLSLIGKALRFGGDRSGWRRVFRKPIRSRAP